jgi:hypothetical protein
LFVCIGLLNARWCPSLLAELEGVGFCDTSFGRHNHRELYFISTENLEPYGKARYLFEWIAYI